jgi:hypothetical protein
MAGGMRRGAGRMQVAGGGWRVMRCMRPWVAVVGDAACAAVGGSGGRCVVSWKPRWVVVRRSDGRVTRWRVTG